MTTNRTSQDKLLSVQRPQSRLESDLEATPTLLKEHKLLMENQVDTPSDSDTEIELPAPSTIVLSAKSSESATTTEPLPSSTMPSVTSIKSVIPNSDSEESDSSLEDIADILHRSTKVQSISCSKSSPPRRSIKGRADYQPSPPRKPKYRFDIKSLIRQAETDDATKASIERVRVLVEEHEQAEKDKVSHNEVLKSIIEAQDDTDTTRVMKAVHRTEATRNDDKWCFFGELRDCETLDLQHNTFPEDNVIEELKRMSNPMFSEQGMLSGYFEDVVKLDNELPDELFGWILQQATLSPLQDLRDAYIDLLLASSQQLERFVKPEHITRIFSKLGGLRQAMDLDLKLSAVPSRPNTYDSQNWMPLQAAIGLLGRISTCASEETSGYCIMLLVRLCADSIIQERTHLLVAMQETLRQLSRNLSKSAWTKYASRILLFSRLR